MFGTKTIAIDLKPLARRFFARLSTPNRQVDGFYNRTEHRVCKNTSFKNGWRTRWQAVALLVWNKWIAPNSPTIKRRRSRRIRSRKVIEARFRLPLS
ncbi:MAG: hypothetical protein IAF58_15880 [Leptolyngbya sp.]|nr:hypothetical protein [Candidatus Melainabacteria bacterium]